MKLPVKSIAWLLPLLIAACAHNSTPSQIQALAPPIEDTPPPKADSAPAIPAPVVNIPNPTPPPIAMTQPQPAKPLPKHKKPVAKTTAAAPAPVPTPPQNQQAEVSAPPEVSAIGHLSSGDPPDMKKQIEDSIGEIERGLTGITRKLSDVEEKTSMLIKEDLKQARAALGSGDVAGAQTLAQKAKVLLGELSP